MRARPRHLGFLALAALTLVVGACSDGSEDAGEAEPTPASVTGVISSIEPPEGAIESFELVQPGKDPLRISIDPDVDYGFDLGHLHEHMDEALPVKVALEERDDTVYATSIEDV